MNRPYWRPVDALRSTRSVADRDLLLIFDERRAVVVRLTLLRNEGFETMNAHYTVLPDLRRETWLTPDPATTLAELARMMGVRGTAHIMNIPPIRRPQRGCLATMLQPRPRPEIATAGTLRLDGRNLLEYAQARRRGERPELQAREARRETLLHRGAAVIDDYASRRLDIAYRIENSALFDAQVPTTQAFEVALVRWRTEADALALTELDALATELEIAYSVARDHAETIGFGHLPGAKEADARRAAKAARLAAAAGTEAERDAALAQVERILTSLALYYLPDPPRKELDAGS